MSDAYRPRYPIYVPSKGREDHCHTVRFFLRDNVDFKIVVEPSQFERYARRFGADLLLQLPEDNMRLLGSRLWIREHAIANGFDRHWQFDDNIRHIQRLHKGRRIDCNSNVAIRLVEDFTDRYTNIGISGFNYTMFSPPQSTPTPYRINCHVYSACLINNRMPYKWRLYYNDDTDLCLQVLTGGLCTVSFNAFCVQKITTMKVPGGNTDDLYQKDGRLKMARSLEAMWPDLVTVRWRFGRPQHSIKNNWQDFKHPLIRRPDIDWQQIENSPPPYDPQLVKKAEIKSPTLRKFYESETTRPEQQ